MSFRRRAREIAFQFLYQLDLESKLADLTEVKSKLDQHLDHFQVPGKAREYATKLVAGTLEKLTEIDETIVANAHHWKMERMGMIDRNILRLSIFEIQNIEDVAAVVTINEAVDIAKQFGTDDSGAFVNGILDAIKSQSIDNQGS